MSSEVLERLLRFGTVEAVSPGTDLFEHESRSCDFFVVISGSAELLEHKRNGQDAVLTVLQAGQFVGDLDLLTGRETLLSCRAVGRSEVLRIPHFSCENAVSFRQACMI